jgi:hypothetical protein
VLQDILDDSEAAETKVVDESDIFGDKQVSTSTNRPSRVSHRSTDRACGRLRSLSSRPTRHSSWRA